VRRSVLGPDVSVGSGAQVYDSVIRDSIIHAGARIEHALLEHSIVGEKAVVTGTSRRANLGSYSTLHVG
jgi:glucose-1-phosphate thymidylyltransferase